MSKGRVFRGLVKRVVSGGQTGVDRAALDWAIDHGIPHGGWCPKGRVAEDGPLDARYALRELDSTNFSSRDRSWINWTTLRRALGHLTYYHGRMRYAEFAPPPSLADNIRCIWIFEDDAPVSSGEPERIVPDGRPELIVHFGAPFLEGSCLQARAVFAGQITRPLWLRPSGRAGVLGVRFHPAGARRFLGLALHEVTDRRISLADLWPGETRTLIDAISTARDARSRASIAADFVARRIQRQTHGNDALVAHCAQWIEARAGQFAIDDLVREAGVGRRQIERRFHDAAGIPPRLLGNILRFRNVFDALEHSGSARWTDAAMAAGYFDQSHLIRDCRRFLGCTPTQFLETRGDLAAALVDG